MSWFEVHGNAAARKRPMKAAARCGRLLIATFVSPAALAAQPVVTSDAVVVTAERRPSPQRDAPLSISTFDAEGLARIGADHPSEILNRAAGVLIHRGSGQESLTSIRSPVLTGGAGAGSFLYLQDGVPIRAAGFANVNGLLEAHTEIAEAIEVVRGPSGAVYGANAIHGVIDVRTGLGAPRETSLLISGDTIGRLKGVGIADLSAVSEGSFAALSVLDDPGFRADSGVDQQKLTVRHIARGERWTATTTFSGVNINQETAGFVEGPDAYLDPVLRRTNPNPEAFRDVKSARLSSRIDVELGEGTVLSVTPFSRWTDMDFLLHFLPSQALEENSHWSVGAQTALYVDRSNWSAIVGFDVDRTEGTLSEFQSIPTVFSFTQGLHYDYQVTSVGLSPFAEVEWRPSPKWTLRAAARLDRTTYDYDNRTDDGVVGRFLRPGDRRDAFTTTSPKFSVTYAPNDDWRIYASYARGARPPQTTDLYRLQINQTTDPAEPETIDAGEIGVRGTVADRLSVEVAGYFMEKDNFFFRDADGFNVSDARTRHAGAEARLVAAVTPTLTIDGNLAYGRHTYRFDRPATDATSPVRITDTVTFGDDVDSAPRWLAGARATWAPTFAPVTAEVAWTHVGEYFTDAANTQSYPGHNVVDVRGDYAITDSLTAFVAVRNVANTFYAERADFAFGDERFFPGEGRVATFGVRAAIR